LDNRTVEDVIGDVPEQYDYSIYPNFDGSIGFTQRGCRLKCGFCVVPKKEGKNRAVHSVADIWRGEPYPKHLHLLDNDFFGQPREQWQARIAEIRDGGFKVCLNQGINTRMIDDESAAALASISLFDDSFSRRRLYTAWDNIGDEERFFRGVDTLERHGIKPSCLMVYMLIGYDRRETWERVLYRFERMVARKIRVYPMVYGDRDRTLPLGDCKQRLEHRTLAEFQRYAIRRLNTVCSFEDYDPGAKSPTKQPILLPQPEVIAHQRRIAETIAAELPRERVRSLKGYTVEIVSRQDAQRLVLQYEWLGTLGNATVFVGLMSPEQKLHGVACFGKGPGGPIEPLLGGEAFCLERGACVHYAPPNAASFLINAACKLVYQTTGVARFYAYSDPAAGEYGGVYQAAGWLYLGQGLDGKNGRARRHAVLPPGADPSNPASWRTTRELKGRGVNGKRMTFDEARAAGWQISVRDAKHVYAIAVGRDRKQWRRQMQCLPYPSPRPLLKRKPPEDRDSGNRSRGVRGDAQEASMVKSSKRTALAIPHAKELRKHAVAIRDLRKRASKDIVEIGRRLTEAKELAGHGHWLAWLDREFGWSERTAQNFMRVHTLSLGKSANFADLNIPISAVFLLAAPSTSPEAVSEVAERAKTEPMTMKKVKATVAEHHRPVSVDLEERPAPSPEQLMDAAAVQAEEDTGGDEIEAPPTAQELVAAVRLICRIQQRHAGMYRDINVATDSLRDAARLLQRLVNIRLGKDEIVGDGELHDHKQRSFDDEPLPF
jgi:hypothetical protein